MTQMRELVKKDIKTAIITLFHMFKKPEKMYMLIIYLKDMKIRHKSNFQRQKLAFLSLMRFMANLTLKKAREIKTMIISTVQMKYRKKNWKNINRTSVCCRTSGVIRVPKENWQWGVGVGGKHIWKCNSWKFWKFDENYKPTSKRHKNSQAEESWIKQHQSTS